MVDAFFEIVRRQERASKLADFLVGKYEEENGLQTDYKGLVKHALSWHFSEELGVSPRTGISGESGSQAWREASADANRILDYFHENKESLMDEFSNTTK